MTYYGVPRTANIPHTQTNITISRENVKQIESGALYACGSKENQNVTNVIIYLTSWAPKQYTA